MSLSIFSLVSLQRPLLHSIAVRCINQNLTCCKSTHAKVGVRACLVKEGPYCVPIMPHWQAPSILFWHSYTIIICFWTWELIVFSAVLKTALWKDSIISVSQMKITGSEGFSCMFNVTQLESSRARIVHRSSDSMLCVHVTCATATVPHVEGCRGGLVSPCRNAAAEAMVMGRLCLLPLCPSPELSAVRIGVSLTWFAWSDSPGTHLSIFPCVDSLCSEALT